MVAMSRRERMVAHDITDVPFLFAIKVRRRTLFQEDPSIVPFPLLLNVLPFDEVEVKPCFVVTHGVLFFFG